MSFEDEMESAIRKIKETHNKIVRTATIDLFSGVIRDTPVDTGRARGNWVTQVGLPAQEEIERDDPDGSLAIAEVISETPELAGREVFLSNALPYIEGLENGRSMQSPAGMVRRNFARVRRIVDAAVSRNRL
tara:strand:- start:515 stop:910 length:396 start_codon:yes stop_codon:yes gene_type:complete